MLLRLVCTFTIRHVEFEPSETTLEVSKSRLMSCGIIPSQARSTSLNFTLRASGTRLIDEGITPLTEQMAVKIGQFNPSVDLDIIRWPFWVVEEVSINFLH